MGYPLSPVLADVHMEYFEGMALRSKSLKPSMWFRYEDDTFLLWSHQEDDRTLMDLVNSIHLYSSQWRKNKTIYCPS